MANRVEADGRRTSRRRRHSSTGSVKEARVSSGNIEETPTLEELRRLRSEHYTSSRSSPHRSARSSSIRSSRMVTSSSFSASRSSSRHEHKNSRTSSGHRHRSSRYQRSDEEARAHRGPNKRSKDDGEYISVYKPSASERSPRIRVTDILKPSRERSDDKDGYMSAVSERSEEEVQKGSRKAKVIYVREQPDKYHEKTARRSRDKTTSTPRSYTVVTRKSTVEPLDILKRYVIHS
jgi:hypothetical protein